MSDPYVDNTFLLLHMDNNIQDTSQRTKILSTRYAPVFSSVHKQHGTHSFINAASAPDGLMLNFDMAGVFIDKPFTMETCIKLYSTSFVYEYNYGFICTYAYVGATPSTANFSFAWGIRDTGALEFSCYIGSSTLINLIYSGITPTQWTEQFRALAITWDLTTLRMFVDGIVVASTPTSGSFYELTTATVLGIGAGYLGSSISSPRLALKAYFDEFRITHDVTRYTDTYTPAIDPFEDPLPLTQIGRPAIQLLRRDMEDGGSLSIIERVTLINIPIVRRVRLCDQISGRVVREDWSDLDGYVIFNNIRQGPWILYALDHENEFQSVIIANRMATENGYRL